jgi:hypothetical protein
MWCEEGDMLTETARRQTEAAFVILPPIALIGVIVGEAPVAWRAAVASVFFLVSPGLAVLAPARFRLEIELAMLLPTSLSTTTLVSLGLFYTGDWTPMLTIGCLTLICAVGVAVVMAQGARRRGETI